MKNFTLHDLPAEERPRERLRKAGPDKLSTVELLALVIEKGRPGENVLILAQKLLVRFKNLAGIKQASLEELKQVGGIGLATACKLQAAFKLGERALSEAGQYGEKIQNPAQAYNLVKEEIAYQNKEHFKLICLNSNGRLINIDDISLGSLTASIAHPREIFQAAIKHSAAGVVLIHNHPSGNVEPSPDDLKTTQRIKQAGELLGIEVLDHLIVSGNQAFSFRQRGLI